MSLLVLRIKKLEDAFSVLLTEYAEQVASIF